MMDLTHNAAAALPTEPTKEDLWKHAELKSLKDGWIVELVGVGSKNHTVYARAVPTADYKPFSHPTPSVLQVVEATVDVTWKNVAKHLLEAKNEYDKQRIGMEPWDQGAFPPADRLLQLGAVWLINESSYLEETAKHHHHFKKKRLNKQSDGTQTPDWSVYCVRVHTAPNRYHAAEEFDFSKYCRGLLLTDHSVQVFKGEKLLESHEHVPPSGYPDKKDGVIIYEDAEHGFAVLNKPGTVLDHASVNNHAEDVLTLFSKVLQQREKEVAVQSKSEKMQHKRDPMWDHVHRHSAHIALPLPLDTETQGIIILATKRAFATYVTDLVEKNYRKESPHIIRKYRCLVCVRDLETMITLNNHQESHTIVTHYYHHNSHHPHHNDFVKDLPKNCQPHQYGKSQMRILTIGTNHGVYAANVTSDEIVGDIHLAQQLWGLCVQQYSKTPVDELGVKYVAQLEVQHMVDADQLHSHLNVNARVLSPQQLVCGQLAAMGFPVVGDVKNGGGTSEHWHHRHGWNQLALQCCEVSLPQPCWANSVKATKKETCQGETVKGTKSAGKVLVAEKEKLLTFRLNDAWWTTLLHQSQQATNS